MATKRRTEQPEARSCECGCGEAVGAKAHFRPSHDAKLKSRLLDAARGVDAAAVAELDEFGWSHFLKPTKAEQRKAERSAVKAWQATLAAGVRLSKLAKPDLLRARDGWTAAGRAPRTVGQRLTTARVALDEAIAWGWLARNSLDRCILHNHGGSTRRFGPRPRRSASCPRSQTLTNFAADSSRSRSSPAYGKGS